MIKNYITSEQFLKQSDEVQKVLVDWWKPQIGDLYCDIDAYGVDNIGCILSEDKLKVIEIDKRYGYYIPLLSETQLRSFIEDNSYKIIKIRRGKYNDNWYMRTSKIDDWRIDNSEANTNLFQVYWQVARNIINKYIIKESF